MRTISFLLSRALYIVPWLVMSGCTQEPADRKDLVDAVLKIQLDPEHDIKLHITDKKELRYIVEEPMARSKQDPMPKKYALMGTLFLQYSDKSEIAVPMFLPWGHYQINDRYMIADLNKLRGLVKHSLEFSLKNFDLDNP